MPSGFDKFKKILLEKDPVAQALSKRRKHKNHDSDTESTASGYAAMDGSPSLEALRRSPVPTVDAGQGTGIDIDKRLQPLIARSPAGSPAGSRTASPARRAQPSPEPKQRRNKDKGKGKMKSKENEEGVGGSEDRGKGTDHEMVEMEPLSSASAPTVPPKPAALVAAAAKTAKPAVPPKPKSLVASMKKKKVGPDPKVTENVQTGPSAVVNPKDVGHAAPARLSATMASPVPEGLTLAVSEDDEMEPTPTNEVRRSLEIRKSTGSDRRKSLGELSSEDSDPLGHLRRNTQVSVYYDAEEPDESPQPEVEETRKSRWSRGSSGRRAKSRSRSKSATRKPSSDAAEPSATPTVPEDRVVELDPDEKGAGSESASKLTGGEDARGDKEPQEQDASDGSDSGSVHEEPEAIGARVRRLSSSKSSSAIEHPRPKSIAVLRKGSIGSQNTPTPSKPKPLSPEDVAALAEVHHELDTPGKKSAPRTPPETGSADKNHSVMDAIRSDQTISAVPAYMRKKSVRLSSSFFSPLVEERAFSESIGDIYAEDEEDRKFCYVIDMPLHHFDPTKSQILDSVSGPTAEIEDRLLSAGLIVDHQVSRNRGSVLLGITARDDWIESMAEVMKMKMKMKSKYGGGYTSFEVSKKELFERFSYESLFSDSHKIAIISFGIRASIRDGGANIDIEANIDAGVISQAFPLHDDEHRKSMFSKWSHWARWMRPSSIHDLRDYCGERIALYFAWLAFYTTWLIPLSFVGCIVFYFQVAEWDLDNRFVPWYCIFTAITASMFLKFWNRRNEVLKLEWGMRNFEREEQSRHEFRGVWTVNHLGRSALRYPRHKRFFKTMISSSVLIMTTLVVLVLVAGILVTRTILLSMTGGSMWVKFAMGSVNGCFITISNIGYYYIAYYLTLWENLRTDSRFEDHLIIKSFILQFFNSYSTCFYIAFVKNYMWFGDAHEECNPNCLVELFMHVGAILCTQMTVGQFFEIMAPYFAKKFRAWWFDFQAKRMHKRSQSFRQFPNANMQKKRKESDLSRYEMEATMTPYYTTFSDYNEIVIQYGFVMLFAPAFPLAPILAFFNNVVELRSDLFKLCYGYQRSVPKGASNLGTWYSILEIISLVAIISNCAIIALTSTQLDRFSPTHRILLVVLVEHGLLTLKYILNWMIPDRPRWVRKRAEVQNMLMEKTFLLFDAPVLDYYTD